MDEAQNRGPLVISFLVLIFLSTLTESVLLS